MSNDHGAGSSVRGTSLGSANNRVAVGASIHLHVGAQAHSERILTAIHQACKLEHVVHILAELVEARVAQTVGGDWAPNIARGAAISQGKTVEVGVGHLRPRGQNRRVDHGRLEATLSYHVDGLTLLDVRVVERGGEDPVLHTVSRMNLDNQLIVDKPVGCVVEGQDASDRVETIVVRCRNIWVGGILEVEGLCAATNRRSNVCRALLEDRLLRILATAR